MGNGERYYVYVPANSGCKYEPINTPIINAKLIRERLVKVNYTGCSIVHDEDGRQASYIFVKQLPSDRTQGPSDDQRSPEKLTSFMDKWVFPPGHEMHGKWHNYQDKRYRPVTFTRIPKQQFTRPE